MSAILSVSNITKFYGGAPAVSDVSLSINTGECVAILGENGAGKSTLCKMMSGVEQPSSGKMTFKGKPYAPDGPKSALKEGIVMVFQETSLVPSMTVAQNLHLGVEQFFNPLRRLTISSQQFLQGLNFNVDPNAIVSTLGAAKKQMIEVARAILHNAKLIIFDEPTATLTPEEKQYFFRQVANLKQQGVSIIYISHALEEALEIADRIVVMRDGALISNRPTGEMTRQRIVEEMVGRAIDETLHSGKKRTPRGAGKKVLSIEGLRWGKSVQNASLSVFGGQITGLFGLVGSGRTEIFKIVSGVVKRDIFYGGEIIFRGKSKRYKTPSAAIAEGIAYVTEDRKSEGFFDNFSILRNIAIGRSARPSLRHSFIKKVEVDVKAEDLTSRMGIVSVDKDAKTVQLSGGNQQKVVIAKSLTQAPDIVIFDEPTRGVDVGAIREIHDLINSLADEGKAVVVISSYLPEILALSDRILVTRQGRVVEEFDGDNVTEQEIMYAAVH